MGKCLRAALNEPVSVSAPPAPVELAAATAKRAASAGQSNLLPAEFTAQYHQQFVDRLWLRGLAYAGLAYAVFLVIYFCAVSVLNFRTTGVEARVAAISNDYTNALQLKARYGVLQERQQLKYAALDAWQLVAQELPPGLALSRFSFANGQSVTLGGQVAADDITKIFDFNDAIRKVKVNSQPVFNPVPEASQQAQLPQRPGWPGQLEFRPDAAAHGNGGGTAMKKYFAQLRPMERRLVVGVAVVLVLVLNAVFIWPHFSDWGALRTRMAKARGNLKLYQTAVAQIPALQADVKKFESEGEFVAPEDRASISCAPSSRSPRRAAWAW